jgi:hypothetical protein
LKGRTRKSQLRMLWIIHTLRDLGGTFFFRWNIWYWEFINIRLGGVLLQIPTNALPGTTPSPYSYSEETNEAPILSSHDIEHTACCCWIILRLHRLSLNSTYSNFQENAQTLLGAAHLHKFLNTKSWKRLSISVIIKLFSQQNVSWFHSETLHLPQPLPTILLMACTMKQ